MIITLLIFLQCLVAQDAIYFNGNRAMEHLEYQCSFGPRYPGSEGHKKFSDSLISFLNNIADMNLVYKDSIINPITNNKIEITNILSRFNPRSENRIMIMAHWDTREIADKDSNYNIVPLEAPLGANDGASGVAIILTLAEILSKHPVLNIGIDLLLVDGEDQGVSGNSESFGIGTQLFSKHIPNPRPEFAICLDMVADTEQHFLMEQFSLMQAPNIVEEIWTLANDLGYFQFEKKIGYAIMDDHYYLYKHAQIPAIDIIDFDYPNKEINYWHTINDTPDNCSSESLKTVGIVMTHYIYGKDMEHAK